MQHEKWRNVTIFGSSYIPSPPWINVGSCDYDRIYASVSTSCFNIDSGGRGVVTNSSPSCEVKIRWCDHFSLRSSLWNGSKNFLIHELLSSKTHALAGSVSELSHTEAIFSPPKWSNSLDASVRIHTSEYVCVRLPTAFVTRGGGGWRPFLHLHVKWCFDDVLIFRCVPLSKNDQFLFLKF